MIRNLKALGLAAFALLAMGALFASGASAQTPGVFTAGDTDPFEHTHTEVKAEQYGEENYFQVGEEGKVECEIGTFSGTSEKGTDTSFRLQAHYTDCTALGLPATITMNGCEYKFNQPSEIAEGTWTSTVDLVCPRGPVVIEIYLFGGHTSHSFKVCTETVKPAEGLGHVIYHPGDRPVTGGSETRDDLTATVDVAGVPVVEDNQACSAGEQEIPNEVEGNYVSNVTVWGETQDAETLTHHDLWISPEA